MYLDSVCTCMYLKVTLIFQLWAKSIDQAKKLYKASLVVRNQGDAIGVLVGAPNPNIYCPITYNMKLQTCVVCLMMKYRILLQAIEASGSQLMDLVVCYTESTKMQLLLANKVVR